MSKNKNNDDTQKDYESRSEILKGFIPPDEDLQKRGFKDLDSKIKEIDKNVYFRIDIASKYLVHLKKDSISKKKIKLIDGKKYLDTNAIDEILVNCTSSDNKFRTIDINMALGRVRVKQNNLFKSFLGTSVHEVQVPENDDKTSLKYTREACFLYAVDKYLQYLKEETEEKVFLDDIELIHPQYVDMNYRYDLYIPSAKICIEYLEEGHFSNPEKIKKDETRKKVIEYEDILVMSFNLIQTECEGELNFAKFLVSLRDNIVERSLYFTDKEITIDQYLFVFKKYGISNIEIAKKMLEIRNKDESEIDIPLEDAFNLVQLKEENRDKALKLISNCLDKDEQYRYSKSFNIENIFLNKTGFCDFCVLIGTFQSRKILKYYREVETMCINMINDKAKYIKEQRKIKDKHREVVEDIHRDNWTYLAQVVANQWHRKYDDLLKSSIEERNLNRQRNQKQQKALVDINKFINDGTKGERKLKNIIKVINKVKFLQKEEGTVMLEDQKPLPADLDFLVYTDDHDLNHPVYLSEVVKKYNDYNSRTLTKDKILEKLEKYQAQIGIVTSSSFTTKSKVLKLTNVKWLTNENSDNENEEQNEDSDNEVSDSESELAKSLSETKLSDSNSENSDSEVELDSDED